MVVPRNPSDSDPPTTRKPPGKRTPKKPRRQSLSMNDTNKGIYTSDTAALQRWKHEKLKDQFESTPDAVRTTISNRQIKRQIQTIWDRLIENATTDGQLILAPWVATTRSGGNGPDLRTHVFSMASTREYHIDPESPRQRLIKPIEIYTAILKYIVGQIARNPELKLSREATAAVLKMLKARHDNVAQRIMLAAADNRS
jgi:hypothetical protein